MLFRYQQDIDGRKSSSFPQDKTTIIEGSFINVVMYISITLTPIFFPLLRFFFFRRQFFSSKKVWRHLWTSLDQNSSLPLFDETKLQLSNLKRNLPCGSRTRIALCSSRRESFYHTEDTAPCSGSPSGRTRRWKCSANTKYS